MKFFTLLAIFLFQAQSAMAGKAPAHAPFEFKKFFGVYRFVKCEVKHNAPIWSEDADSHYIEISNLNGGASPNDINMYRWSDSQSPVNLGVSLEKINEGKQTKIDPDTQKISNESESYTTVNGVYNFQSWNFKDLNVGWTTVQLKMDSQGNISYEMRFKRTDDKFTKEERCTLKRK